MSLAEWSIATDCGSVHKKRHGFKSHRTPKGNYMTIKIADEIEDFLCNVGNLHGYCYIRKEAHSIVTSLFAFLVENQYLIKEVNEKKVSLDK